MLVCLHLLGSVASTPPQSSVKSAVCTIIRISCLGKLCQVFSLSYWKYIKSVFHTLISHSNSKGKDYMYVSYSDLHVLLQSSAIRICFPFC